MNIISQDRTCIIDYDNVIALKLMGTYIYAHPVEGVNGVPLAHYDTKDLAKTVFEDIIKSITSDEIDYIDHIFLPTLEQWTFKHPE